MSTAGEAAARLDRPGLGVLVDELHHRLGSPDPPRRLRLRSTTDDERRVLADLLGAARLPRDPVELRVAHLLAALGLSSVDQLCTAVEILRGPVVDRRATSAAKAEADRAHWTWLAGEASRRPLVTDPVGWVQSVRRRGIRGSRETHHRWCEDVLRVLDALPADALTLAELAQDTLDDPHALDTGGSRAAAVLAAVAPGDGILHDASRRDAEATRLAWESVGVAPDALSSTVLTLGLPFGPSHPFAGVSAAPGPTEPVVLTLSQLRRWPLAALPAQGVAFVVENPSLISAAAREGWVGPPLVCSSGRPTVAVVTLVRQLAGDGATVRQHADLDPVGVGITSWLAERAGTLPWRMTARAYLDLVGDRRSDGPTRAVAETPWDPSLQSAMSDRQVWAYEEQVRGVLLGLMQDTDETNGSDPTA